jgi:hypothetical protein
MLLSLALFLGSVAVTLRYAVLGVRRPGMGRILFWSLISLKVWAGAVLSYFSFLAIFPGVLLRPQRLWIAACLAVYLVVQGIGVNVALYSWRRNTPWWRLFHRRQRRGMP